MIMKEIKHGEMSRDEFIEFIYELIDNFKEKPQDWENTTIDSYLDALVRWVEDMDGYYKNQDIPLPENIDWSVFASILIASTMYE